jgi:hypothetical protein
MKRQPGWLSWGRKKRMKKIIDDMNREQPF